MKEDTPRWRVQLSGERFDLEELPRFFSDSLVEVTHEGDRFFLASTRFQDLDNVSEVRSEAENLVQLVNGALFTSRANLRTVGLGPVHEVRPDGTKQVSVSVSESIQLRAKSTVVKKDAEGIVVPGGSPDPLPAEAVAMAIRDRTVAEVLQFLGSSNLDWADLYKIVEMITEACGKRPDQLGWVSGKWLKRFRQTANSKEASGLDARHAKAQLPAPKNPPNLDEARTRIRDIVREWIQMLANEG